MDSQDISQYAAEFITMLSHTTAALATIQGIELGFFDRIPVDATIAAEELSQHMGFDISRVERWLRFAVAIGYVRKNNGGFSLTPKGMLLNRRTPVADLLGLHHMVGYFTKAVSNSKDAYQNGVGLDSITHGKISRDYIPRVAAQLSHTSAAFFSRSGVSTGHTILDLGCGDGSVLREVVKTCPGVSATGIDINPLTLDMGKRQNEEAGLQDQIELRSGDVTNMADIKDGTFDWVYAINVFHFLPVRKRGAFLREMIRVSRYGIFVNQVITNNLATLSTDVLLATLFTDFTGFFTQEEADELVRETGNRHFQFLPIIQGESRLMVMYTSRSDVPLKRVAELSQAQVRVLESIGIRTALDFLVADASFLTPLGPIAGTARQSAIKILFP